MHGMCVFSGLEAVKIIVERMKTALEEAWAHLSITKRRGKLMWKNRDMERTTKRAIR